MNFENQIVAESNKDSITIKSILCIFISALITCSIGSFFTKYLLRDVDKQQSLISNILIVFTLIQSIIQIISFIITMLIFYYLLKLILNGIDFGYKITPKKFINISGYFCLIKGISVFILTLITSYIYNYTNLPFENMINKWTYNSNIINIISNFIFLIFMSIYYGNKIFNNKNKIKISLAFLTPYVIITILPFFIKLI
ncbi:hypothetical protein [Clostridium sp. Marseille-Q2269]|uniref:hypothetical protein n=1 Tax=Clostridium sp. Marseille-Q2269 TaxID=2942205 RepID=UPI002073A49C|nr:hypothetical protein [Clostridium sp. Marseille-Q2269]